MAAPAGPSADGRRWWDGAVGYEIYVRSFQDSDGDGIGDLPGIRQRLPYLAELGVDVVWLTPFYPSPQADHGYDVSDYRDVDPRFGDLADAEALFVEAHELGLRVLVDLVPNHTSDQHPWFRDALTGRDADHRDWYVWRDPAPDGGPPNNWVSHFGGPAWTLHEPTGQYYMHLFLPEQPDLNWANPEVRDEFEDILRFWFERGADGVRIDVAHSLLEDPQFRDNPVLDAAAVDATGPRERFAAFDHRYDLDQPDVTGIYRRWRRVAAEYDALLLGEVYLLDPDGVARYVREQEGLHQAFCFLVLHVGWDADELRGTLRRAVSAAGGNLAWPAASHDDPHPATRFGGGRAGARRAHAFLALLLGLPGSPYLLQGDELGLEDGEIDRGEAEDPISTRNPGATGRDGSRTPMPWEPGHALGFTTGQPWLPVGANRTDADTVEVQAGDPGSWLERTRGLLALRARLPDLHGSAALEWIDGGTGPVLAFRRGGTVVACNMHGGETTLALPGEGPWELLQVTAGEGDVSGATLRIPADATAWVTRP